MEGKKGNVLSRAFKIAAQGKGTLILSCLASVLGMLAEVLPYLSVYSIIRLLLVSETGVDISSRIWGWAALAGISIVIGILLSALGSIGCHRVAFRLLYEFRMKVMEHLGRLPMGFFGKNTSGEIQKVMDENIEKIEGFVAHMLPDISGSAAVALVLFAGLFAMNGWLAATVLLAVVLALAMQLLIFSGKNVRQITVDVATSSQKITGAFSEYVKGIAEVKLFGLVGTVTRGLQDNIEQYRKWELKLYKRSGFPMTAYKTIVVSMLVFVLPVGIVLMTLNPSADTMLAVLMSLLIAPAIYDPLMTCVNYGTQLSMLSVGMDDIDNILKQEPIARPRKPQEPQNWNVRFDNVSFSYQGAADPMRRMALDQVTFDAPQRKTTALVGESGGGKSTVGQLLSRFWDVESGKITIGGVDIRDMEPDFLMAHVATVFQDTYLFSDTIRGNITMNRPCAEQDLIAAAKAAQCHAFIMALPDGYDTKVGSGGVRLSGGEAQRISIARAIMKNAPIVVLDEALAYADAENENLIQKAIHNLLQDRTVLIIAHRLQSIQNADQILVLREGGIIERGTHTALMASGTEYHTLWALQHEADAWDIMSDRHNAKAEVMV